MVDAVLVETEHYQNGLIFGKVPKGGGGVIFNPKIYIAKFGPLNSAFSAWQCYKRDFFGYVFNQLLLPTWLYFTTLTEVPGTQLYRSTWTKQDYFKSSTVRKKPEHKVNKKGPESTNQLGRTNYANGYIPPRITPLNLASCWQAGPTQASPGKPPNREPPVQSTCYQNMHVKHAASNTYHLPAGREYHTHHRKKTAYSCPSSPSEEGYYWRGP